MLLKITKSYVIIFVIQRAKIISNAAEFAWIKKFRTFSVISANSSSSPCSIFCAFNCSNVTNSRSLMHPIWAISSSVGANLFDVSLSPWKMVNLPSFCWINWSHSESGTFKCNMKCILFPHLLPNWSNGHKAIQKGEICLCIAFLGNWINKIPYNSIWCWVDEHKVVGWNEFREGPNKCQVRGMRMQGHRRNIWMKGSQAKCPQRQRQWCGHPANIVDGMSRVLAE